MKKSVFVFSQIYLEYINKEVFERTANHCDLILIVEKGEEVSESISQHMHAIYQVEGNREKSLRSVFNRDKIDPIIGKEVYKKGANNIRIFCQQEDNVYTAAKIREHFNIPGDRPEVIKGFTDKIEMKRKVQKALPEYIPAHLTLDKDELNRDIECYYSFLTSKLSRKMIVKPTSGNASLDVFIIESLNDLVRFRTHLNASPYSFDYEVDEFIEGTMYECDAITQNGEVVFSEPLELSCTNLDFVHGHALTVIPETSPELVERFRAYNKKVIAALGLENGATHHEFFYNKDTGRITFLEIAARIPGGMVVPFHEKNTGINMLESVFLMTADMISGKSLTGERKNNTFAALLPVGNGEIKSLNTPDIKSAYEIDWFVEEGMDVSSVSAGDRAGVLYAYNDDFDVLRADFSAMKSYSATTCI